MLFSFYQLKRFQLLIYHAIIELRNIELVSVIAEMHKKTKMDLRQLEVFINLAESLNHSKTAENLHLSQPAVSRII